jgi:hypothetical protein
MDLIRYATRGQVKRSPEISSSARLDRQIDDALLTATESIHGLTHKEFYPVTETRYFDWPIAFSESYQLWLDPHELASAAAIVSGGVTLSPTGYLLRRSDGVPRPPYNLVEIDLSSSASFEVGATYQNNIAITGTWNYPDVSGVSSNGLVASNITDIATTLVAKPGTGDYTLDVGALILIGTERMWITRAALVDSGQNLGTSLTSLKSNNIVSVSSVAAFAIEDVILIEAERMRITDIAGTNLIVERAVDGATLAAHTSPQDIHITRSYTVERGALGSIAAAHTTNDPVYVHLFPSLINSLAIAEAVVQLEQSSAGYARTIGSGPGQRETAGKGLEDLRDLVYTRYGRKCRKGAI